MEGKNGSQKVLVATTVRRKENVPPQTLRRNVGCRGSPGTPRWDDARSSWSSPRRVALAHPRRGGDRLFSQPLLQKTPGSTPRETLRKTCNRVAVRGQGQKHGQAEILKNASALWGTTPPLVPCPHPPPPKISFYIPYLYTLQGSTPSLRITNSTRRFFCFPSSVSLSATGAVSPHPTLSSRSLAIPQAIR